MFKLNAIKRLVLNYSLFRNAARIAGNGMQDTGAEEPDEALKEVKMHQDPNLFGSLKPSALLNRDMVEDQGDLEEREYLESLPTKSQKLRTKQYADMIKDHLRNKKIHEAIQIVEERMVKEDRVKPENYIYNLLIDGCARSGYTQKAFGLYNKMKQRNLKITGSTYTSLFNACANSPWPKDGLDKANHLREIMAEKGYIPNITNYNAMIKAFGRCGDVKTAFEIVDELTSRGLPVQLDTFNFLLQACISDKELGFRHALLVWQKMRQRKLTPDIYSFNLLLRCTRDCDIGDLAMTHNVIQDILIQSKNSIENGSENLQITADDHSTTSKTKSLVETSSGTPNLISISPSLGNLIALSEIHQPEDRLLLLGGMSGFLNEMALSKATPTIKTFTELLDVTPSTLTSEKKIISSIRMFGIKADIDFFNILIKKRSMRFDYTSAREVLQMIRTAKLHPDIVTYGVLSLGCKTLDESQDLINEMKSKGIRMNIQILGAMLKQGCYQKNFEYIHNILKISTTQKIKPNKMFLSHLDKFTKACRYLIKQKHPSATHQFRNEFSQYRQHVHDYFKEFDIKGLDSEASFKSNDRPLQQFKVPQTQGFEKEKGEKLRHNQKTMRYIRRINPNKLKDDEE